MKFLKKLLLFTIKEIYSFFIKFTLFIMFLSVIFVGLIQYSENKSKEETKISSNYNYVLFNPANISEDKLEGGIINNSDGYDMTFRDMIRSLDDIKNNDNIKGVIIDLDHVDISNAKVEEVIKKFNEIKAKNKKIYAIGSYLNRENYTLASVANEIITFPSASASVSLTGYNYSDLYYKKLLDKIGVNIEVVRIGNYKSYGENYVNDQISNELKTELTRILDNRHNRFLDTVSKARKIDKNTLDKNILDGNFTEMTPFTARDNNLVDKLEYKNNLTERLNIRDDNMIDIYTYFEDNRDRMENDNENKTDGTIAVIYAEGSILYENDDSENTISITPDNIAEKLEKVTKIPDLKGIVLRVNSPGGSALASEMIYQLFKKVDKPIYVSMSESAASGGYYISMVGNKVFADNATITGSIGVVSMIPKLYNAQNKYGITQNSITKGKYTDLYNTFVPLSEEGRNKIISSMTATYDEFKSRVKENRKLSSDTIENYAQGKIWLGDEAKEIKLVDNIASLDETIKLLAKDLNLKNDNYKVVDIYREKDYSHILRKISMYLENIKINLNLGSKLESDIINKTKIYDEYKFIEKNQNRALFYLPYTIKID